VGLFYSCLGCRFLERRRPVMRAAWRPCAAPLLVLLALAATAERPSECASWARSGECQSNPAFMQLHCAAECEAAEVVVDPFGELEQCAGWAEQGECTRNPKFMLASCPKNCAKQRASVHEVLVDELITCIDDVSTDRPARTAHLQTASQAGSTPSSASLTAGRGELVIFALLPHSFP